MCVFAPVQLSVGAVQDFGSQKPKRSFRGCLENLLYNGLNLIELAKNNDRQVTAVVSTFHSGHDGEQLNITDFHSEFKSNSAQLTLMYLYFLTSVFYFISPGYCVTAAVFLRRSEDISLFFVATKTRYLSSLTITICDHVQTGTVTPIRWLLCLNLTSSFNLSVVFA